MRRLFHNEFEAVVGLSEIWQVCAFLCAYTSSPSPCHHDETNEENYYNIIYYYSFIKNV